MVGDDGLIRVDCAFAHRASQSVYAADLVAAFIYFRQHRLVLKGGWPC